MPLRLVTGRANTGKTGIAYSALREAVSAGRPAYLLLPTAQDVGRARQEWASRAPMGLSITTFPGFTSALWERYGDGRRVCSSSYRSLAMKALARSAGSSPAMAALACEGIDILCKHTGDSWRRAGATRVPRVGREMAELIKAYADLLDARGLLEEGEATHLLAVNPPPLGATVVVHQFADFAEDQLLLVQALAQASNLIVTLTWEAEYGPTEALTPLVERLEPDLHDCVAPVEDPNTAPELQLLEAELFAPRNRLPRGDAIRLTLADGVEAEAQVVADEAALALAEGAASAPERLAIAYRDLDTHRIALARALARVGLPASFESPTKLRETALGMVLLSALAFCAEGTRSSLLAVVRSPFSGIPPERARLLEAQLRRLGDQTRSRLLAVVSRESGKLANALSRVSTAQLRDLDATDVDEVASLAMWLLRQTTSVESVSGPALEDASAYAGILGALDEVREALDEGIRLEDLIDALGETKLAGTHPEQLGHIQVVDATRLRGRRFDTVIVGGLSRGEFPAPVSERLFPHSAADRVLRAFGVGERATRGPEFDQALFYDIITRARRRLVLSACAQSESGEPLGRSPLFEAVADFLRLGEREDAPEPVERYVGFSEMPDSNADDPRIRARAAAMDASSMNERAQAARRRRATPRGAASLPRLLGDDEAVSASQIEAYLACPYRWFYNYVLRPRTLEEEVGARTEGEWAHQLLAEVYRRLIEAGVVPLRPESLPTALTLLENASAAITEASRGRLEDAPLAEQLCRMRARAWAKRVLQEDSCRIERAVPAHIEWPFGGDGVPIDLGGGLRLVGRVDRIDIDDEGRAVVVDYKRSAGGRPAAFGAKKMLTEGRLQLPLYLLAVQHGLGATPVAGLYRGLAKPFERGVAVAGGVDRRLTSGDVIEQHELETLLGHAVELARAAVAGMRAGEIPARPRTKDSCKYCPLADGCGGGC